MTLTRSITHFMNTVRHSLVADWLLNCRFFGDRKGVNTDYTFIMEQFYSRNKKLSDNERKDWYEA